MRVWIVAKGAYDNWGPSRVFSSLDRANAYISEKEADPALEPYDIDQTWDLYGHEGFEVDGDGE